MISRRVGSRSNREGPFASTVNSISPTNNNYSNKENADFREEFEKKLAAQTSSKDQTCPSKIKDQEKDHVCETSSSPDQTPQAQETSTQHEFLPETNTLRRWVAYATVINVVPAPSDKLPRYIHSPEGLGSLHGAKKRVRH